MPLAATDFDLRGGFSAAVGVVIVGSIMGAAQMGVCSGGTDDGI
jgi:hypothetical protein